MPWAEVRLYTKAVASLPDKSLILLPAGFRTVFAVLDSQQPGTCISASMIPYHGVVSGKERSGLLVIDIC